MAATTRGSVYLIELLSGKIKQSIQTKGAFRGQSPEWVGNDLLVAPTGYHKRIERVPFGISSPLQPVWVHNHQRPYYYDAGQFLQFFQYPPAQRKNLLKKLARRKAKAYAGANVAFQNFYPTGPVYTSPWAKRDSRFAVLVAEPSFPPDALYSLYVLNPQNGAPVLKYLALGEARARDYYPPPALTSTGVFASLSRKEIAHFNVDSGEKDWSKTFDEPLGDDLFVSGSRLFVTTKSGKLMAFKSSSESRFPKTFGLGPNTPNPFNPMTLIDYQVAKTAKVSLKIFNVRGQEILTLVDSRKKPGFYSAVWNGRGRYNRKVPSGFYVVRFSAGSFRKSLKMMLQK